MVSNRIHIFFFEFLRNRPNFKLPYFREYKTIFFFPSPWVPTYTIDTTYLSFFLKKNWVKNHVLKQNHEKNWNISLITLSIIAKEKTTFEIFLTKRKLIKCNFFHSYKLLTLFSLYLYTNKHFNGSLTHVHR